MAPEVIHLPPLALQTRTRADKCGTSGIFHGCGFWRGEGVLGFGRSWDGGCREGVDDRPGSRPGPRGFVGVATSESDGGYPFRSSSLKLSNAVCEVGLYATIATCFFPQVGCCTCQKALSRYLRILMPIQARPLVSALLGSALFLPASASGVSDGAILRKRICPFGI